MGSLTDDTFGLLWKGRSRADFVDLGHPFHIDVTTIPGALVSVGPVLPNRGVAGRYSR